MTRALRALPKLAACLVLLWSLPAQASDLPSGKPMSPAPSQAPCQAYGPNFHPAGFAPFCYTYGFDATFILLKDFAKSDLMLSGRRLPTATHPAGGAPTLFYATPSFAARTAAPRPGADIQLNAALASETAIGTLVGFVNLRGVESLIFNKGVTAEWGLGGPSLLSRAPAASAIDQAWLKLAGVTLGVHASYFNLPNAGYGYSGGYASQVKLPLLAYTQAFGDVASASIALEDPVRRTTTDGILSSAASPRLPELVGQARFGGDNWLLHVAGAAHQIRDNAGQNCCAARVSQGVGHAVTAGAEVKMKWSDVFGGAAGDMYGRFMLSGAYAVGAVSYLGAPNFAVDTIADENGALHRTQGRSLLASYEHVWSPTLKSTLTYSLYGMSMGSGTANVGSTLAPVAFDLRYHVRGSAVQIGAETLLQPGLALGGEIALFHDHAQGVYTGTPGGAVNPGYVAAKLYLRRSF